MCGIAGFVSKSLNKEESQTKITNMINSISHRGPDSIGVVISNRYSCATARLSIEKIKEGYQPIITEDRKYIFSFNGEIFNYKKIIKKYSFKNEINSEIKLLAELFFLKGEGFINEIQGQFAISIYDVKQDKLYLYRDRFGIRPLFYKIDNQSFVYASEIKSISAYGNSILETSNKSIASTSLFWTNIGDLTSFKEIKQLPPGHYLQFSNNEIKIKKYWINSLADQHQKQKEIDFIEVLKNSIQSQLHGEVGYSSYLSGGVDSSVIAYLLTEIQGSPIDTFSIEFENKEYDESDAQKQMQNFINSNHHSLKISDIDIVDNFENVIHHSESHLFRTAPVPMYLLAKEVKKKGHKVVFTGEGADEILLGYDIFGETKIREFWSRDINSEKRSNLLKKLYFYLPQFNNDRYFQITKQFFKKNLKNTNNLFYSHQVRWDQYSSLKNFFNFENDENIKKNLIDSLLKSMPENFIKLEKMKKAQLLEINTLLSNYLLSSQGDRMSMAHGVEGRYPYLDDEFTKVLAGIPSKIKSPGLKLKNILRESFKKYLPKEVISRPKFAYQAPEGRVFFNNKKGKSIVNDFADSLSENDNLNRESFLNLISKFKDPNTSSRMGFRENMAFIIGLSEYFLKKCAYNWYSLKNSDNRKINYEYYS